MRRPFRDEQPTIKALRERVAAFLQTGLAACMKSLDGLSRSLLLRLLCVHLFQLLLQQSLFLFLGQLGEQQYKLQAHAPGRNSLWMDRISVELRGDVHRLESEL